MSEYAQNHRLTEVGRDLWRSSGPTPLIKQGHLEPVVQDHVQTGFEYLQGWRLHSLSGKPVLVLLVKKCSLRFRGNLLCF